MARRRHCLGPVPSWYWRPRVFSITERAGNLFQTTKLNTSLQLTQGPYSALFPIPTLSIRNIGEKPIAIQDISINDRPECTTIPSNILTPYGAIDEKQFNTNLRHQMWIVYVVGASPSLEGDIASSKIKSPPVVLQVGEEMRRKLFCPNTSVANATVSTDEGTGTWRWNQ